jgi:hypothetical protein
MPLLRHRTGLKHARPDAHARFFARAASPAALPPVPASFGSDLFPNGWGMLGNATAGDCTIAGLMHAIMEWRRRAGQTVHFTELDAFDDYSAVLKLSGQPQGYVPADSSTDTGCDMVTVAQYAKATGMRDCADNRYKVAEFASIAGSDGGNPALDHVYACAYLFGACGIGIALSDANEQQFERGETWTPDNSAGEYHFVPVIARGPRGLGIVTWGKGPDWPGCWLSEDFFQQNCKEAIAYLQDASDPNASLFAEAA